MLWIQRGLLILVLVFAALTTWLALEMRQYPPPENVELPNGFKTPILALEFPRNSDDLLVVLDPENERMLAHLYVVQLIDEYFPWAYGGLLTSFLASVMFMLWRQYHDRRIGAVIMVPLLAFLAYSVINGDFVENQAINQAITTLSEFDDSQQAIATLDRRADVITRAAWHKWTMIGAMIALVSLVMVVARYRILAGLVSIPTLATLYARFLDPSGPAIEFMAQAIAVFFLAIPLMAVYFLVQSFRRTESPDESPRQVES